MKRIVFMICLLGGWMTCCFAQGIVFCELTLEAACRQADSEGKYVFVDCYTSWCGPCKMMHPVLEDLKKQLVNSYQVQAVPTLMLFKAGKMVWRQSGAMQATQIRQVIEKHL